MSKSFALALAAFVAGIVIYQTAAAAPKNAGFRPERAAPPQFPADVNDVFFLDAREKLVGERPAFGAGGRPTVAGGAPAGGVPGQTSAAEAAQTDGLTWSKLIAASTIEDEVKSLKSQIDATVTTPGEFKGGRFREARIQFSTLATMFHIAGNYDADVRWKDDAPGLRDLFSRAGFNNKVGTDQSYNESKVRKQDLDDLIRGDKIAAASGGERTALWDKVTNRPPLMSRIETAYDKKINPYMANKAEFSGHAEEILHESQVLAAIAEAIQHEGFEFWDDDDYLGYARRMRDAAVQISDAVKQNNYDAARAAAGEIGKACTECHEGYRS